MDKATLSWLLLLGIGFPLLGLLLSEVSDRLEQTQPALASSLRKVLHYVLPPLSLLLLTRYLLDIDHTGNSSRLISSITWMAAIVAALSLVNSLLTPSDKKSTGWQLRVPNLFFQIARAAVVIAISYHLIAGVWSVDLSGIVTAVGVSSLVVALALQSTLSNLVSGLLLLIAKPFKPGDWIIFDGVEGRVVDQNWWSVTLEHNAWEKKVIVPNGALSGAKINNFGDAGAWKSVEIEFSYDDPPNRVLAALKSLEQGIDESGLTPFFGNYGSLIFPLVKEFGESGITYVIWYKKVPDRKNGAFKTYFLSRIYYMAKREGFTIPYPISIQFSPDVKKGIPETIPVFVEPYAPKINVHLRSIPYFQSLQDSDIDALAEKAKFQQYGKKEVIVQENQPDEGFYILLKGQARVWTHNNDGELSNLHFLRPGDVFGEMALFPGELSPITVIAEEDVELILIGINDIVHLIQSRSGFGFEIIQFIEGRKRALRLAKGIPEPDVGASRNGYHPQKIESNL